MARYEPKKNHTIPPPYPHCNHFCERHLKVLILVASNNRVALKTYKSIFIRLKRFKRLKTVLKHFRRLKNFIPKKLLFNNLMQNASFRTLSGSSRFRISECTYPMDENSLSSPADDGAIAINSSISWPNRAGMLPRST